MTAPAGYTPAPSTTARPADKGASEVDKAARRRTIDALVSMSGCRRKEAGACVDAWVTNGRPLDDLQAWIHLSNGRTVLDRTATDGLRAAVRKRGGRQ